MKAILYIYIMVSTILLAYWYCWLTNTDNLVGFFFTVVIAVFAGAVLFKREEEE